MAAEVCDIANATYLAAILPFDIGDLASVGDVKRLLVSGFRPHAILGALSFAPSVTICTTDFTHTRLASTADLWCDRVSNPLLSNPEADNLPPGHLGLLGWNQKPQNYLVLVAGEWKGVP
ncbi:hypothetical protein AVEN_239238-1 [Araneus ventricosus]|uniref:Uncharacterized protein n=1 Tax=Araneus ventricosus TaxID=182803 RepID=A0A4Y2J8D4_ARAVE|nr:hypothetical protein AVEN_239238-1 [Araneus ventricosus]